MTTHTTRHLRRSLLGVAYQSRPPDEVVVSCDNQLPEIADLVRACSAEFSLRIVHVAREHMGECRVGQARNNAVRTLKLLGANGSTRVVYLDGDCCPAKDALAVHGRLGSNAGLVIGFRVELTPEQTEAFDEGAVKRGTPPASISNAAWAKLFARDAKYRRQLFLKKFGLCKPHKPKVLSANFSLSLAMIEHINGFDEEFIGYGAEDDDVSRRVYLAGGKAAIAVRDAVVFHQWHPTRAAESWEQAPGVARFKLNLPSRCARGITHPLDQPNPEVTVFDRGSEVEKFIIETQEDGTTARAPDRTSRRSEAPPPTASLS